MKTVLAVIGAIVLCLTSVGIYSTHQHNKSLWEDQAKDFPLTSKDREQIKSELALVGRSGNFEFVNAKAEVIFYCNAVGCVWGKNEDRTSLTKQMTALFLGMAAQNRLQQQKAYEAQQKSVPPGNTNPAPAKPVNKAPAKPKGQSKLEAPIIQNGGDHNVAITTGRNSPIISDVKGNVSISDKP